MNPKSWLSFLKRQELAATFILVILVHLAAAQNSSDGVALLAIKSMIKDDPQGLMMPWNASSLINFCQWQGVTCSPPHQRVTVLDLSSSGLVGTLSPSIGNLSFLRELSLQNNSFSGGIPPELGRLSRLQVLGLHNNSFQGNIPATLSNCSNLQVLRLGFNKLVGSIPDEFGSLSMLTILVLHRNSFQGGIPRFISNLTRLQTLTFADCGLGGTIPDIFYPLKNLTRLAMAGNNLVGTIPPSLYNLTLTKLFLDNNSLTGRLPMNLGYMKPGLQILSLSDNHFTGPLPPSIISSPVLEILDVSRNNLSGKILVNPRNTCRLLILFLSSNHFGSGEDDEMKFIDALSICSMLQVLDIGNNQMRGFLPESLGNLSNDTLSFLRVAWNAFSGSLPSSVGNLSGLTSLDLSNNQLEGTIPVSIGNLQNLQMLDFRNNSFSGNIPDSLGNLSLLIELHLDLNELNGTIPSSLGNCKKLIDLSLNQNNLIGDIPRSLFELSSLSISLNLGSNQLSGTLPPEVGNLKNLNEIILSKNRMSGDLPSSLGSCNSLQNLNLSSNFFGGSLPDSLRSLRALQNLDLSHNNFSGEIPSFLEGIDLEKLDISFNCFEGEVSSKGVFANASAISVVGNNQLCGGIPELQLAKCGSTNLKKKKKLSLAVILAISLVPALFCVSMVLFIMCYRRKREIQDPSESVSGETPIQVSFEKLHKATKEFSPENLIGEGSFSSVYRGYLYKEGMIVAIKVLNLLRKGGSKSFLSECEALRNARHRNLVRVITCCSGVDFQGNEFKAIVYEYMPNGSLDRQLHNLQIEFLPLNLLQRVCIALDVAYALDYLHHQAGKTIVHCDLKPSNILLDEDMVAHVGDFGLAKILQSEYQNRHHSSSAGLRGTIGYAAPEYGLGSKVSTSADMYSYGILLLEMITGKKPTDAMFIDELSLHTYARTAIVDDPLKIIDPVLVNNNEAYVKLAPRTNEGTIGKTAGYMNNETCLRLLLEIGVACSMESPQYRMDTATVIQELLVIKDAILGNSSVLSDVSTYDRT